MKLTMRQRSQLRCYERFRNRDMSVIGLFWFNRTIYALLLALAALTYLLALKTLGSQVAFLIVVWFVSLVLRDVGFYIRSRQFWHIHRKLLDWPEIERLLGEDSQRNSK
jgi:hypothetical protein